MAHPALRQTPLAIADQDGREPASRPAPGRHPGSPSGAGRHGTGDSRQAFFIAWRQMGVRREDGETVGGRDKTAAANDEITVAVAIRGGQALHDLQDGSNAHGEAPLAH